MGDKPRMIGRVDGSKLCPRCRLPMILIEKKIVTTGGLVDELWLCPLDGVGCDTAVAIFPTALDAFGAEVSDDYAEELAARVQAWYREQKAKELLREGEQIARAEIAEREDEKPKEP